MDVSESTVREFIDRINRHDVEGIIALCAHAHRFVDGLGQVLTGYDQLRAAWAGYFHLFPDYRIDVESLAVAGESCWLLAQRRPLRPREHQPRSVGVFPPPGAPRSEAG